jgi:hypothetical protein
VVFARIAARIATRSRVNVRRCGRIRPLRRFGRSAADPGEEESDDRSQAQDLEVAAQQAPQPPCAQRACASALPHLRRAQAAPSRLRQLRKLPRTHRDRDGRGLGPDAGSSLPGTGIPGGRNGPGRLRGLPGSPLDLRGRRCGPGLPPLAPLLPGPRAGAAPDRAAAARHPDHERGDPARPRGDHRGRARVRGRPQPGRVHRPGGGRRSRLRGRGGAGPRARPLHAGGGSRRQGRHGGDHGVRTRRGARRLPGRGARLGRGRGSRELQLAAAGRDLGQRRRRRAGGARRASAAPGARCPSRFPRPSTAA